MIRSALSTYRTAAESGMIPAQHRVLQFQRRRHDANLVETSITLRANHQRSAVGIRRVGSIIHKQRVDAVAVGGAYLEATRTILFHHFGASLHQHRVQVALDQTHRARINHAYAECVDGNVGGHLAR